MTSLATRSAPLLFVATALLGIEACGSGATVSQTGGGASGTAGAAGSAGTSGAGGEAGAAGSGGGAGGTATGPFCGDGNKDPGEACDDANQSPFDGCLPDCTIVKPLDAPPLKWTYYEVPGTRCMNGETAGFGVSLNPNSKDVMIYLEGGGACFNDACDFSTFSVPFIPPPDGIFNRDNQVNPVKNWNMVYVPYCSGDIHAGDKDTMLAGKVRYFHGYRNIAKYLEQWVVTFAGADRVLLTGISAGGFGAGLNAAQVANAFGPGPQMIVIDDSGPPLSSKVIAPCLQQTFRDVWGIDNTFLAECGADCPDKTDFATGWMAHVMKTYPDMRFGVFSNTADLVIRAFMGFGWGDGKLNNCAGTATPVPAKAYEDDLLALRAAHKARAGSYYIGPKHFEYNFGQNHTVLRSPTFWTTIIDGVSVPKWVGGVIDGKVDHVGP